MDIIHAFQSDIIVWIFMVRGFFMLVAGGLFFYDPILRANNHIRLRQLTSIVLCWAGISAFTRIIDRSELLLLNHAYVADPWIVMVDIVYALLSILLVMKLGYDYYVTKTNIFYNLK